MAVTQSGAKGLLHIGKLDEAESGRHVDHPVIRDRACDGVDELGQPPGLLDRKVDPLENLDAVR